MGEYKIDIKELRSRLLTEIYAGAFAGMPAMILEESEIRHADEKELVAIAKRYGIL